MADDPLESYELVFLLGLAFQLVLEQFVERLDRAGYGELRPVHGFVFQAVAHDELTSSELAERLGVTKQAAGQMVDYLEDRGYVERRPHPRGGRRRLVVLTVRGRQHLDEAGRILGEVEAERTAALGPDRLRDLRAELVSLVRAAVADGPVPPLRPVW